MTHVDADAVPMMLLHGTNDSLVPVEQARSMVDLLRKESSNPAVYVEFPGAQHAFDVFASNRTNAAVEGIERFLNVIRAQSARARSPRRVPTGRSAGSRRRRHAPNRPRRPTERRARRRVGSADRGASAAAPCTRVGSAAGGRGRPRSL